jgi:hypothetical protein
VYNVYFEDVSNRKLLSIGGLYFTEASFHYREVAVPQSKTQGCAMTGCVTAKVAVIFAVPQLFSQD